MKDGLHAVCHGQESLKNIYLGDRFRPQFNIGFSNVSVVGVEDCHMQEDSSNPDYVFGNLAYKMNF